MKPKKGDRLVYTGPYDPSVPESAKYGPGIVIGLKDHGTKVTVRLEGDQFVDGKLVADDDFWAVWPIEDVALASSVEELDDDNAFEAATFCDYCDCDLDENNQDETGSSRCYADGFERHFSAVEGKLEQREQHDARFTPTTCTHCKKAIYMEGAWRYQTGPHENYQLGFYCDAKVGATGILDATHEPWEPATPEEFDAAIASVVAGIRDNMPEQQ